MHDPMGQPHELVEHDPVEHWLILAAKTMALSGGILFIALIGMSLVSIVGRKLGFGPVNGDIELMQSGTAVAAAAFLPYCTILGEHLKVDFFTEKMRAAWRARLDGVADFLLMAVMLVLAWRTVLSAMSAHEAGEVTMLVSLPVWIPIAAMVPSLILCAICAGYRVFMEFGRRGARGEMA